MTNQSQQPLTLKLSNGREVAVPAGKSVLQFTENGQPRSCAIVQGPNGVAVYNAKGDIQINGAPSSAHWLQPGDELRFGDSMTASVQQLGLASEALNSLLNENTQPTTAPVQVAPAQAPVTNAPASFTPATAATDFVPPQAAASTPVESHVPVPVEAPTPIANAQDSFTPATGPTAFTIEPQVTAPMASPVAPATPDVSSPGNASAMDFVVPAAATGAALAASAMSITEASQDAPNSPPAPTESGFNPIPGLNPITSALESVTSTAPTLNEAPVTAVPVTEAPITEAPITEAPAAQPEISGFAADLLARIQADDNENETVGTQTSENTHSPLAADGHSFSSPAPDVPELSQTLVPEPEAGIEQTVIAEEPNHVETTPPEPAEQQTQSNSVSELLERMKADGQWNAEAEIEEETIEAVTPAPEPQAAPAVAEADDDVQSYMSQLLSRMRDPNAAPKVAAAAPTPDQTQVVQEVVEPPQPAGLLKPEEFVPKNKAKRLDSLQEMRALANTQTRTAIDRSQAKRKEAANDTITLAIAIVSCIAAAVVFFFNIFGDTSFAVGMVAMIAGAFFCCRSYFSEFIEIKKPRKKQPAAAKKAVQEIA